MTAAAVANIIQAVFARIRPALVAVVASVLVVSALLAPEHFHAADDHHQEATLHRHFSSHAAEAHGADAPRLDHPDRRIMWRSDSWLHNSTYQVVHSFAVVPHAFALVAETGRTAPARFNEIAPPHGPPRPTRSLRAPPVSFPAVI